MYKRQSEYDPDGCAACVTPQYGYRNGLLYPAYTAASFIRALDLSDRHGVNLQGALTWAFEYDNTAYFDGFRVLTTNGIDKPVLNVHRMFGKMTGQRVSALSSGQIPLDQVIAEGIHNATDVGVLSSLDQDCLYIFVWHYHDNDLPKPDAEIKLDIKGLPWSGCTDMTHYRIDDDHSNSYTEWLSMGSPQQPSREQYNELARAGKLTTLNEPHITDVQDGQATMDFSLPIRALSLIRLEKA